MQLLPDPPHTTESAPSVNHREGSPACGRTDSAGLGTTTHRHPEERGSVNVDADTGKTTRRNEGEGEEPEGETAGEGNGVGSRVPKRAVTAM